MTPLYPADPRVDVTVSLYGVPVVTRMCTVRGCLRLGEHPDAAVSFPGADLLIVADGGSLRVRGRTLGPGEGLEMHLGAVHLRLVTSDQRASIPIPTWTPDLRIFVATLALALLATTWETAGKAAAHHEQLQAALQQLVPTRSAPLRAEVGAQPSKYLVVPAAQTPPAIPDHLRPPVRFELLPAAEGAPAE